jgi:non-specific serine/threonine protein kinase/serine/threonine-protein kinase
MPDSTKATDDLYQDANRVFADALGMDPAKRLEYLGRACQANPALFRDVVALLENHDRANRFFERPVISDPAAEAPMIGRRIGSYRILRQIGMGGMGAVHLAERADDQFRKCVALKTLRPDLIDEHSLHRFQNERQTLAVLDHPNIIKLLDGGTTGDGIPYLVMEYAEGEPIHHYCRDRKLSIRQRVELFRIVLGAVHYAHQNLVVHRDLKPGNILVTADGSPKLLDFGIAKLQRPEYSLHMGLTQSGMQPMTPHYASPEQIRGQPITTASDTYSLGVVLYELLAENHPYEGTAHTPIELQRSICETEPMRPSKVAAGRGPAGRADLRSLRGDLDTIVLMAMRKEPHRRYASVEHFSEDLRRYLAGWPVLARKAGVWYKTQKFVGRHKAASAAAVVFLAGLIGSGAVALREKRAAERRFEDLRNFANFTLNDLDDKLRDGATPARSALTAKSLEYLDGLAREKNSPAIQRDLVNGYIKTGDVQGNLYGASLGETALAEESYRKALAIAEGLPVTLPENVENGRLLARAHMKFGEALANRGARQEGLKHLEAALQINESIRGPRASDVDVLKDRYTFWFEAGSSRSMVFDSDGAIESYRRALETAQKFPDSYSGKASAIAGARELVAYLGAVEGETQGAEDVLRESIATYQGAIAANPKSGRRRTLAKAYKNLADLQKRAGKIPEALASLRQSLAMTEQLLREDPKSAQNLIDRQQAQMMEIDLLIASQQMREAEAATRRALAGMKALADQPGAPYHHSADYAELLSTMPFADQRNDAAALQYARKAVAMTRETDPGAWHVLALAYVRNGDAPHAMEADQKALSLLPARVPGSRPPEFRVMLEREVASLSARARQDREPGRQTK